MGGIADFKEEICLKWQTQPGFGGWQAEHQVEAQAMYQTSG